MAVALKLGFENSNIIYLVSLVLFDSYPRVLVRDAEKYTRFTEHELQSATPLFIQT